jgi:hypothetical protein
VYVELDASELPVRMRLEEAEDFGALKVVAHRPEHVYLSPQEIRRLAGADASPSWLRDFERMVAYAKSQGWVREDGAIRAHVEWLP